MIHVACDITIMPFIDTSDINMYQTVPQKYQLYNVQLCLAYPIIKPKLRSPVVCTVRYILISEVLNNSIIIISA